MVHGLTDPRGVSCFPLFQRNLFQRNHGTKRALPAPARAPASIAAARVSIVGPAVSRFLRSAKNLSGNLRGIVLMLISTVAFAAMHAAVRHLSGELHPFEIAFFRNAFGLLALAPWFLRYGLAPPRTRQLPLHGLRAGLNIIAMLAFFYALSITPLARVTSLGFTVPLFATLLAMVVLGEVVRLRRWAAMFCGFVGTLVILRPGLAEIDQGSLLALLSAACWIRVVPT